MALHRKFDALLTLEPDVAVISECAEPGRLLNKLDGAGGRGDLAEDLIWVGRNPNKGLAVISFNGYKAKLMDEHDPALAYVAPVEIVGDFSFMLLAVWAQNLSGGNYRKDQPGPLRLALDRYRSLLATGDMMVAGDLNNNVYWDRPGWPINHANTVDILAGHGLESVYHAQSGEAQGAETVPTIYWRDRKQDGPTYHLDYIFLPTPWLDRIGAFGVGSFEEWCGSGLSDHVPLVLDVRPG